MKLNALEKTNFPKIRVGRGIGSGKGKTSGRGVKGQKSRSGVAIKSFEGGQMPLYRRLPKRGFKKINKKNIAIINLVNLEFFLKNKKIKAEDEIDKDYLIKKGLIRKKCDKLKILGKGDLKSKLKISTDFISESAKSKIEKAGGSVIISKNKININKKNV
jgi:large subunit ribosomal protein L15